MSSHASSRSKLVCPCHDVTERDIEDAIRDGHRHPETIKRATAVYMGMCQGKYCQSLVQDILTRHGIDDTQGRRRPATRVPVAPIPLGLLIEPDERDSGHSPQGVD